MEQYESFHSIPVTIRSKRHLPTGRHVSRAQGSQYRFRGDVEGRAAAVVILTGSPAHVASVPAGAPPSGILPNVGRYLRCAGDAAPLRCVV